MNLLFVCLGNICRSPTAEAVFRHRARTAGLDLTVDSAGTGGWHSGDKPDSRAMATGQNRGYSFDGQHARKVLTQDFEMFNYILAMDRQNLNELRLLCPIPLRSKVQLFLDYAPHQSVREVLDPYYGGDQGFETVLDLIEQASDGLIAELKKS